MLLAGHCSPVQLPACDQALGAPSAQWVPRAARSLRLWPRDRLTPDAPSVFPGLPCPFLQAVAQSLGPCSLLPLELCGPPGSVRAPVGALATHTARFLGPALLPTLDACLAHGGRTAGARLSWPLPAPSLLAAQDNAGALGLVSSSQTPVRLCFQAKPAGGGFHWDFAN